MSIFGTKPDPAQIARLAELEKRIDVGLAAFHKAGLALAEIRDQKLYAHKWKSFETYTQDRWGWSPAHVSRLINAANVCENLTAAGVSPLPANEAQARVLAPLPADKQRDAWKLATEKLPIGELTAEALENVVDQVAPKRRRARHRKPKAITLRGKGWKLTLTRRAADVDAVAALSDAIAQLRAKQPDQAKAA